MKLKRIAGAAALALVLIMTGCSGEDSQPSATAGTQAAEVREIDPADAYAQMSVSDDYVLLDVRTAEEYAEGHIAGATLLPVDDVEAGAAEVLPDKNKVIYVYCRSGRRSAIAAAALADLGYVNVYDMGGLNDWPYGTVTGSD